MQGRAPYWSDNSMGAARFGHASAVVMQQNVTLMLAVGGQPPQVASNVDVLMLSSGGTWITTPLLNTSGADPVYFAGPAGLAAVALDTYGRRLLLWGVSVSGSASGSSTVSTVAIAPAPTVLDTAEWSMTPAPIVSSASAPPHLEWPAW